MSSLVSIREFKNMIRHHEQYFDYPFNAKLREFLLENTGNGNRLLKLSGVNTSPYKGGRTKLTSKKYNELYPFILVIRSAYVNATPTRNKLYIDKETLERSDIVKEWCTRYNLRTSRLARYVFPNMNDNSKDVAIAMVKKYEYVINDVLWEDFKDGMNHIERVEKMIHLLSLGNMRLDTIDSVTLYHLETMNINRFIMSFCNLTRGFLYSRTVVDYRTFGDEVSRYINAKPIRKAVLNEWLHTDRKVKLRLANIAYILNYSENKDDLIQQPFSLLARDDFFTDEHWNQIQSVMNKVNEMIVNQHPFALGAKFTK